MVAKFKFVSQNTDY